MHILTRSVSAAALYLSLPLSASAAGFSLLAVDNGTYPDLEVGVWYPTEQSPPAEANTLYELPVALDAPVQGANGALIVISHGFGGWYAGHADMAIALADAGYVVAAPSHTGNTWSDMSASTSEWMLTRPQHISRVIDHLLDEHAFAAFLSEKTVGVYGFSAGGFTALSLIGAVPDFDRIAAHCAEQADEFACGEQFLNTRQIDELANVPAEAWGFDPRIQAAVIAAPGFGFAYTEASLQDVRADVQLWSGELDDSVPTESNAANLARGLPQSPETHWVPLANHFAFMTVSCRESFRRNDPEEYEVVCGDADGFDRYRFHDDMHREMLRFFGDSLRNSADSVK